MLPLSGVTTDSAAALETMRWEGRAHAGLSTSPGDEDNIHIYRNINKKK